MVNCTIYMKEKSQKSDYQWSMTIILSGENTHALLIRSKFELQLLTY